MEFNNPKQAYHPNHQNRFHFHRRVLEIAGDFSIR